MYSPLQREKFPPDETTQIKLTPNLRDKEKYTVHYRNLKLYTQLGMRVTKIHRVLSFEQKPWLKEYIDYNTNRRSQAKSKFEKDFYKLMNNSVFGKTQENLRKRMNVELITDSKTAKKRVAKPSFKRSNIITEDLVVMQCHITTLKLDRPIYVGFTVLELSKLLMYDFHYNHMKKKYPGEKQLQLLFTDTDSLAYSIQTDDIYKDMEADKDLYDFSEYPYDHYLYSNLNKKSIGKFKDELNSIPMVEFIGLRPKCYSLLFYGIVKDNVLISTELLEKQTAKGVKKSVKERHRRHKHYKKTLEGMTKFNVSQNLIKSKCHTVSSYHVNKIALTAYDTKRWLCCNGVNTLAYGHYRTFNNDFICQENCIHVV